MKRLTIHLLVAALVLAAGYPALAEVTTKNYFGSYNGDACTVQLTWHNWTGLGPIDGRIRMADGTTISLSGSNSGPGVLDFKANGKSFRLVRRDAGRKASWVSARLSFTEGVAPTPTPTPTVSPTPTPEASESAIVDEVYSGSWKGKAFTAHMRWAPGDTPDVIRRGRGTITTEDGSQFSIEGWQPSADSTDFSVTPDEGGATYKTTKVTTDGKVTWESSALTLTEKK